MEANKKTELINQTIQKLIEETKKKKSNKNVDEQLLSTLLSQLESLGEEESIEKMSQEEEISCGEEEEEEAKNGDVIGKEEIVNELRKVRKQNLITHCLLSVMIVFTLAWQFSEVTILLKVKDGVSHPFRSVGSVLVGMFKGGPQRNGSNGNGNGTEQQENQYSIDLPHIELPELNLNGEHN